MLARPEWSEREEREPMYPRAEREGIRVFIACLCLSTVVWLWVIFPIIESLRFESIQYNSARFGLRQDLR